MIEHKRGRLTLEKNLNCYFTYMIKIISDALNTLINALQNNFHYLEN